eukprot:CAMPEP_0197048820 /NCGR_PEP_ID=MMETSP1384-20130603/24085_1 /TAXON_ID=29189 /ORGANISM="Ammonia sp." /LENGTH=231 /DNA_ID=CAMNT_0042481013 /DNA_START=47 /DNA_END=740 /DNA_ORIENTATION=+
MDEIFATCMSLDELEQLSDKLQLIQAEVQKQQMSLISFDQLKDPMNPTETKGKLQKFIECVKWNVTNGDDQSDHSNNYFHITSYGDFEVGPNKIKLHFWASIGDQEGEKDGEVYLGTNASNLWEVEMNGEDTEIEASLENIQQFVQQTGIKGIGKKQVKDNNVDSDEQKAAENAEQNACWYTYHAFLNDLTEICLDLIETKSGENIYGDLDPEFEMNHCAKKVLLKNLLFE